jgi:hypothetical protein
MHVDKARTLEAKTKDKARILEAKTKDKARILEAKSKAKARTLKAKAKDVIFCPRGSSRPRPVLEDYITGRLPIMRVLRFNENTEIMH